MSVVDWGWDAGSVEWRRLGQRLRELNIEEAPGRRGVDTRHG